MTGKDFALTLFVTFIWGFNYSMIKLGVTTVDPLLVAAARFICAVFPLIFFIRKPDVSWRYLIGYGVVFGTGIWGMASCAITLGLSASMASVLIQTDVLTTALVGVWLYKEKITSRMMWGMLISLVGLVISISNSNGNVTLAGVILILISAICWPLAGVIVRASKTKTTFAFNVWGMLFAPVPLIALSLLINGFAGLATTYQQWNSSVWLSVLFQAYPTTLFGYWIWNRMVLKYDMNILAPLTPLITMFALIGGYFMFGEQLSLAQWVACSAFLAGIWLVITPGKKEKLTASPADA
ncbi:EamA family transporter [Vibrio mangrovi]|uniref:EamA family transporter n=1 Tax=Vibrio mangrovi TaxID=474394 RepID=A0A1Y6IRK6_9VIBR|nr:EamA family transporter [Vibrio mangrovi]MDW6003526.1 EamA family transporter [Vibrio mangrovi]SMR99681.1 putative amino-acid metabolite efflux pump [Vibrio mangrovi]